MSLGQIALYLLVGGLALLGPAELLSVAGFMFDEWNKERQARQLEIQEAPAYYRASRRLDDVQGQARDAIIQRVIRP